MTDRPDSLDTLSALLEPHLSEGYPSENLAASLMGTSVRTLARRLSESGVRYQDVVDNLRYKRAVNLLSNSDRRIINVASAVGFSDLGNFSRMFRRVGGIPPREFRQTARH